ncbi:MAG: hypothetical protein IKC64_02330 [Clostridia bacterium]|nr:hypothetical protein [Clostridia bacterium]
MVVYCVGNAFIKRAEFRRLARGKEGICLDNDDMLVLPRSVGKTYFAHGETPFGNFKVGEYIEYNRSLILGRRIKRTETKYYNRFFSLKLKLNKRMRSLSSVEYRYAQFLSRYTIDVRKVYIVFDGIEFSAKNKKRLDQMVGELSKYFHVFISVSDYRFIPQGATVRHYQLNGEQAQIDLSSFRANRSCRKVIKSECINFTAKKVVEVTA